MQMASSILCPRPNYTVYLKGQTIYTYLANDVLSKISFVSGYAATNKRSLRLKKFNSRAIAFGINTSQLWPHISSPLNHTLSRLWTNRQTCLEQRCFMVTIFLSQHLSERHKSKAERGLYGIHASFTQKDVATFHRAISIQKPLQACIILFE